MAHPSVSKTGTQLETSQPAFSLPAQYWTQFIVELLKRSNLPTSKKSGRMICAVPDEPLLRDMGRGLEAAAKGLPSKAEEDKIPSADGDAPVSTHDFMANLAQRETAQRARHRRRLARVRRDTGCTARDESGRLAPCTQDHAHVRVAGAFGRSGVSRILRRSPAGPEDARGRFQRPRRLARRGQVDFFLSVRLSLGNRTPLEALAKGKVDAVMAAAQAFADA